MNIGRNDPCPCLSGKKYKKCCLPGDEAARAADRAQPAALATAPSAPPPAPRAELPAPPPAPPDPRLAAWNERWEQFDASDYAGQLALFQQTLDEPELMDGEMAFEMLEPLFRQTIEHGERDRFDALVAELRARCPEAYAANAQYLLDWLLTNALVRQDYESVAALAQEWAPLAGQHIDMWHRTEEMLAYHGQLAALVAALRRGWPGVRASKEIVPWGIDDFARRGMDYELLAYAAQTAAPDPTAAELLTALRNYAPISRPRVAAFLAHLTGQAQRQWTMDDFDLSAPDDDAEEADKDWRDEEDWDEDEADWDDEGEAMDGDDEDEQTPVEAIDEHTTHDEEAALTEAELEAAEAEDLPLSGHRNLYDLTVEFIGYLQRVEGVPATKAALAARDLRDFLVQRKAGKLEYQESMSEHLARETARRERRRKVPPVKKFRAYQHTLIPDRERLDRFLAGLLQIFNLLYYRSGALFEIVPGWLRFLETRGLIDAAQRRQALAELTKLADDLRPAVAHYNSDPALRAALESWRAEAAKELPA